jgi:hypothetical protein
MPETGGLMIFSIASYFLLENGGVVGILGLEYYFVCRVLNLIHGRFIENLGNIKNGITYNTKCYA